MTVKQEITTAIKDALSKLGITDIEPQLEIPQDYGHGDYSTNVALVVAKRLQKNPMEVAEEIVGKFKVQSSKFKVAKTEVVMPGFINFRLSKDLLGNYF